MGQTLLPLMVGKGVSWSSDVDPKRAILGLPEKGSYPISQVTTWKDNVTLTEE